MPRRRKPVLERFWAKVEKAGPSDCWLWTAGKTEGYGKFMVASAAGVSDETLAHRFSYYLASGQWPPDGLDVRHSCHNHACVNPRHLRPGTRADNMQDMVDAGRSLVGELQPNHKLTWELVESARCRWRQGQSAMGLARECGVSERTMRQCLSGETWRHRPRLSGGQV